VVAVIHSMEAGGDFTRHLHNGDPLTARTTHVPAGRPRTGKPPFTWEASAIDALTYQGFGNWKDWSVPGTLYKLEGYNGFGYRDHHPQVLSPYLWSFSNHYARGKYVADGRFSQTAVSQQCGAAVLLKRLQEGGRAAVAEGPRVLQLANPHMTGDDIGAAQRLLLKNKYGSFDPGGTGGELGDRTAGVGRRPEPKLAGSLRPSRRWVHRDDARPLPANPEERCATGRPRRLDTAEPRPARRGGGGGRRRPDARLPRRRHRPEAAALLGRGRVSEAQGPRHRRLADGVLGRYPGGEFTIVHSPRETSGTSWQSDASPE